MHRHSDVRPLRESLYFIGPEDWPAIDGLVDSLIDKNRSGYRKVNSVKRLEDMKAFMRGSVEPVRTVASPSVDLRRMACHERRSGAIESSGAGGGHRTHTGGKPHGILSPPKAVVLSEAE